MEILIDNLASDDINLRMHALKALATVSPSDLVMCDYWPGIEQLLL
jgi:hypothetical protein